MREDKEPKLKKCPEYSLHIKSRRALGLFDEIRKYIAEDRRYRDPNMTAARLAKELHTNTRYISAVMVRRTGSNYNNFINHLRLNDAVKMLRSRRYENMSIEEIAIISGFMSRQAFYLAFKKRFDVTPAEYRNRVGQEEEAEDE